MEVAMPVSGAAAIDCYEDMFKEITRKLYGEDGLPEISTGGGGAGGDRPATSSQGPPLEYDVDSPLLKPEEHLTAFGLAALMQNGFPLNAGFHQDRWSSSEETLHWTQSKIASYNPAQKVFRCAECDCVGHLPKVAEHWLGTHSNLRAFQCPQCPYESAWAKCVRMHLSRQHNISTDENTDTLQKSNPVLQEISKYLQKLKVKLDSGKVQGLEEFQGGVQAAGHAPTSEGSSTKRYTCTYCPYATDRRDLFTRHENIHREEKPFQCYVCQKQFNRADHVKKHFLRMHREHPYDLNRIRRHPPKNASGMSYYQKYNSNTDPIPTLSNLNSLSIPNGFNNTNRTPNIRPGSSNDVKNVIPIKPGVVSKGSGKKKGEKRFSCCYCSWSGVDNWCLKRHMNTHLKPFVCGLCDYKAARSERLATHVLKVHNKRACGKCSFLADDPTQLTVHQQEHHPLEQRNRAGNILRNTSFNSAPSATASCSQSSATLKAHELSAAAALLQHSNRLLQADSSKWKPVQRQHGAARLFNYLEASDGSEPESEPHSSSQTQTRAEDMSRINLNHRIQSDFPEAGDAGSQGDEEEGAEEPELPLFVCPTCGCEFEDDASLETHQHTHAHRRTATSPAKENINPKLKYRCRLCECAFESQQAVMAHMSAHSSLAGVGTGAAPNAGKRPRKQSRPKKMVPLAEAQQTIGRRALCCVLCKRSAGHRYHSKGSLALHQYWKHLNRRYKCEHCEARFRHRYQCLLHASRAHVARHQTPRAHPVPTKEAAAHEGHHLFAAAHSQAEAHKLGMAFFDHSFVHPGNAVNGHMPIIIPTFPPN